MSLKELQENRAHLANQIKELAGTQETWSAENKEQWDKLNADYDTNLAALNTENERLKASAAIAERLATLEKAEHEAPDNLIGRDGASLAGGPLHKDRFGQVQPDRDVQQSLALQAWCRAAGPRRGEVTNEHLAAFKACGGTDLHCPEFEIKLSTIYPYNRIRAAINKELGIRNALSGQLGSAGGFTFGDSFVTNLEKAMLAYGGMFQVSEVIRTTTAEPLRWPTATDTANSGRQIGESAAVTTLDPTFGQVVWSAHKFTSDEVKVPFELLRDNAVNLVEVLSMMLGERLGRIQNTKFTTGTGAMTPKGITLCAAAGVTAASATAIAFDEIIDLEHSLDPSRRSLPGVGYMFHDGILKAIRKLKDGNGQYLWQSGANSGAPDTLNGYPYQINQDMQTTVATATITMLFGQFSMYKIRQVNSVRIYRLVERHRENDQDAFLAFIEADGNLLDAGDHPVKKLTQA